MCRIRGSCSEWEDRPSSPFLGVRKLWPGRKCPHPLSRLYVVESRLNAERGFVCRQDIEQRLDECRRVIQHGDTLKAYALVGSQLLQFYIDIKESFHMVTEESNGRHQHMPVSSQLNGFQH